MRPEVVPKESRPVAMGQHPVRQYPASSVGIRGIVVPGKSPPNKDFRLTTELRQHLTPTGLRRPMRALIRPHDLRLREDVPLYRLLDIRLLRIPAKVAERCVERVELEEVAM